MKAHLRINPWGKKKIKKKKQLTKPDTYFCMNFKEYAFIFPYACPYWRETCPGESYTSASSSTWGKKWNQGCIYSEISTGCELPQKLAIHFPKHFNTYFRLFANNTGTDIHILLHWVWDDSELLPNYLTNDNSLDWIFDSQWGKYTMKWKYNSHPILNLLKSRCLLNIFML